MKTQKYEGRLPTLRCSLTVEKMIVDMANEQHISLAEAHRQTLARGLMTQPRVQVIPLVGEYDAEDTIHFYPEAA